MTRLATHRIALISLSLAIAWLLASSTHAAVTIAISPNATVHEATVLLGDIATIQSSDQSLADRISEIDLEAIEREGESIQIESTLIELRLNLAGFDMSEIEVRGSDSVTVVRKSRQSTDQLVLSVLKTELAELWQVDANDVLVTLVRPLRKDALPLGAENYDIKPIIANQPQLGSNQVRFGAYQGGNLKHTFVASVELRLVRELAVAVNTIPAGKLIADSDVEIQRRPFREREALYASSSVVGLEAARILRPGDLVAPTFVRQPRGTKSGSRIAIKRRARIRLVAVKGGLTVSIPQAEALDDGAVGDTIRVRNLQSGKVVWAQVEDSQSVMIKL